MAKELEIPEYDQIVNELRKEKLKEERRKILKNTLGSLLVIAAFAVTVAYLFLPVFKVTGTGMAPTLVNGDILIGVKYLGIKNGDIVAFSYNNKTLMKRVIGIPGDTIDIDNDGVVTLNGSKLDEPYVKKITRGNCDMTFPYQVPENRLFVLGDNRGVSIDSRSITLGCISEEYVMGKIIFRVYPFDVMGRP